MPSLGLCLAPVPEVGSMRQWSWMAIAAGLATFCAAPAGAADTPQLAGWTEGAEVLKVETTRGQIDELTGVVYAQIIKSRSVRPLHMSLLIPRTAKPKPAVVYFPGGGFTSAEHDKFLEMRLALARSGFVVASAQYRAVPDTFPALVQDAKAAVRYLRAHAKAYGIDPARIGALGDSAGGYVVQMLGMTSGVAEFEAGDYLEQSSEVQAVATIYGISNLLNIGEGFPEAIQKVHASPSVTEALLVHGPAFRENTGATIFSDEKKALAASPLGYAEGKKPPFLIMHGSADTLVSPVQSAQLYRKLKELGGSVEYILVEGAEHGDLTWYQEPVIEKVTSWFIKSLGGSGNHATTAPGDGAGVDPDANL